ncbi:FAD-dependent oxidoreductase [Nocardioides sp. CBS4Y-1]|uniref:FAD-dependent oxidoreductase n=1 Tax=Nocardioides acrostichi TaxID=2784339 RepID=A0A930Y9Y3_9ACTN|nr:FAD-dependent oxidoreductase [Nocardioides acrostichi]
MVVAGLGDTGVLTAVGLRRRLPRAEIVGVSPTTELVSGQELGMRLADPTRWQRDYRFGYDRIRGLDGVRALHGTLTDLDVEGRVAHARRLDGTTEQLPYDVLVVATGVANGFWRDATARTGSDTDAALRSGHERVAAVADGGTLAVVGGGAAAVSAAANLAARWPRLRVHLYHPGALPLPSHHARTARRVREVLARRGVVLHPEHRAELPTNADTLRSWGSGPLAFTTGQPPAPADLVLWAVGRVSPHTGWLPADLLDGDGFVRARLDLTVPGAPGVFAIGDVAATDPLRSSARNFGHRTLVRNVAAHLRGAPLREFRPPRSRWGSVLGPQPEGLDLFGPTGRRTRVPAAVNDHVLQGFVVRRVLYRGVDPDRS